MKTSNSITKIAPAILAVQRLVGGTKKDKTGKILTKNGSYEYKYSDLSSVLDEIKGPLNDNGIAILQSPTADASGVAVITRLLHESGEWIEETLYMPVTQGTPQAFGSAITYCRRYAAQSILGLKAEDDDGKEASATPPAPQPLPITGKQVAVDALEAMSPEEQDFIRTHAAEVERMFKDGGDMYRYIESQHFDTEEKLAIWALLPSNVRSAVKKQAPKPQLVSQA